LRTHHASLRRCRALQRIRDGSRRHTRDSEAEAALAAQADIILLLGCSSDRAPVSAFETALQPLLSRSNARKVKARRSDRRLSAVHSHRALRPAAVPVPRVPWAGRLVCLSWRAVGRAGHCRTAGARVRASGYAVRGAGVAVGQEFVIIHPDTSGTTPKPRSRVLSLIARKSKKMKHEIQRLAIKARTRHTHPPSGMLPGAARSAMAGTEGRHTAPTRARTYMPHTHTRTRAQCYT
jgi:hypothetical protein